MAAEDTKEQIARKLRSSDEPALSAANLAEELDVSVRTINNHVGELTEDNRIATTQIGNARAYYIPFGDRSNRRKPDHTCSRCGREVDEGYDFTRIDTHTYFESANLEGAAPDFYILCRFCYADFVHWVFNDPGAIGEYPRVHSWSIPYEQLDEVRDNPDILTNPGHSEMLNEAPTKLLNIVEERETEDGVPKQEIVDAAKEKFEMRKLTIENGLRDLSQRGYIYRRGPYGPYYTAK